MYLDEMIQVRATAECNKISMYGITTSSFGSLDAVKYTKININVFAGTDKFVIRKCEMKYERYEW